MATDFELRHQTLLHFLLVSLAFLSYLLVPDDIVWAFVKDSSHAHLLERSLFAVATLLIGAAAAICTWARAYPAPQRVSSSAPIAGDGPYRHLRFPSRLGNLLFAVGLGSLAPLPGFLILVAGQALLDFRLIRRAEQDLKRAAHPEQTLPRCLACSPRFAPVCPPKVMPPTGSKPFGENPPSGDSSPPCLSLRCCRSTASPKFSPSPACFFGLYSTCPCSLAPGRLNDSWRFLLLAPAASRPPRQRLRSDYIACRLHS